MRGAPLFALLLLAGACDPAPRGGARATGNDAAPPPAPLSEPANQPAPAPDAPDESGLADMSPSQRRAYEAGLRDCRAGRYEPDRYPEAYRIGCAAAEDGKGGGAPEG